MSALPDPADPETALMLAYVPADRRDAIRALFALDDRLRAIVAAAREPVLGEMRLLWWRDALAALDTKPAPAEPLLRSIAESLLPLGVTGAELSAIEQGWAVVLGPAPPDESALLRHGESRGGTLFMLAGRILEGAPLAWLADAGAGWALADLSFRLASPQDLAARALATERLAAHRHWPSALRPLGMLATLAKRDAAHPQRRRQASPFRMIRMLAHRIVGR